MTKSTGENEDEGNARGKGKSPPRTPRETADAEHIRHMSILECPICYSHRASVLETHPSTARCADCGSTYKIKTVKHNPVQDDQEQPVKPPSRKKRRKKGRQPITPAPPINARDFGTLTDYINDALQRGPEGFRAAQREANRFARKFGLTHLEPQWFVCTQWLKDWAQGNIKTNGNTHHALASPSTLNKRGQSDTRLRVRGAISLRARFLTNYAMTGSIVLACRKSKISEQTFYYHKRNDKDFAQMVEDAKAHCIDLLHARCMQRSLEGDIEPVHWQGVVVDYIRKFDSRLQIEMLRAHMPNKFKTPGGGPIHVETGDKILAMDEATRARLIQAHREAIMDMPTTQEGEDERRRKIAEGES